MVSSDLPLYKTADGFPYYMQLPTDFRVATREDFYIRGEIILGKPYLIHSMVTPGIYWGYRTEEHFMEQNDFPLFLERGRIYVLIPPWEMSNKSADN